MRTTLDIETGLLAQLKEKAAKDRTTVSQLANQLIRMALHAQNGDNHEQGQFQWHTVKNGKTIEGFDPSDRSYLDLLDQ